MYSTYLIVSCFFLLSNKVGILIYINLHIFLQENFIRVIGMRIILDRLQD